MHAKKILTEKRRATGNVVLLAIDLFIKIGWPIFLVNDINKFIANIILTRF